MKKRRMSVLKTIFLLCCIPILSSACVSTESSTVALKANDREKSLYNESSKFALIVGVSQFADDWIADLNYAVNDAEDLYQTLTLYNRYPGENVKILTNAKAKKAVVIAALKDLAERANKENDVLLFLYSGHGVTIDGESALLPADARLDRRGNLLKNTLIGFGELQEAVSGSRARKIFFLDACRTGVMAGEKGTAGIGKVQGLNESGPAAKDIMIISAAKPGMASFESPTYHASYLSYALNNGLRGKADIDRSGFISLTELVTYIDGHVKKLSLEEGRTREQEISIRNVQSESNLYVGYSMFGWEQGKDTELALKAAENEKFTILEEGATEIDRKRIETFNTCYATFKQAENELAGKRYKRAQELYNAVREKLSHLPYTMNGDENFVLLDSIAKSKSKSIDEYFKESQKREKIKHEMNQVSYLYERAVSLYRKAKTLDQYRTTRANILSAIGTLADSSFSENEEYKRSLAQLKEWLEEIDTWIISIAVYEKNISLIEEVVNHKVNSGRPWYLAQKEKLKAGMMIVEKKNDEKNSEENESLEIFREPDRWSCYDDVAEGGNSQISLSTATESVGEKSYPVIRVSGKVTKATLFPFVGFDCIPNEDELKKMKSAKGIEFKVMGDGHNYRFRCVSTVVNDWDFHLKVFTTEKDQVVEVAILYKDLRQTGWGKACKFDLEKLLKIGFQTVENTRGEIYLKVFDFRIIP